MNNKGFSNIAIAIILLAILAGIGGYLFLSKKPAKQEIPQQHLSTTTKEETSKFPQQQPLTTTQPGQLEKKETSVYENEYMKITLLPGWTAKPATNPAGVTITKDNYIIHIETMAEQASGIRGGRIEELAGKNEAPSLYAVVTFHPGGPCGSSEARYISNKYVRVDWYIDSQDKDSVCTPPLEGKVWYLSYITNRENRSYINYYGEEPPGFTISMTYNSNDVNKLPKKDSAELNAMLNEMTNIVKTLEIKKPSYIKIAE